ncbi:MAG: transporter substrate-binding domain-containing protein [Sedimenticola sp.]
MKSAAILQSFGRVKPLTYRGYSCVLAVFFLLLLLPNLAFSAASAELTNEERAWLKENPKLASVTLKIRERVKLNKEERQWLEAGHKVPVRVGDYPPFFFTTDGNPEGLSIDYVKIMCMAFNLDCHYVTGMPLTESFASMQKAGGIAIQPAWQRNPEREKLAIFTNPYLYSPFFIFQHKGDERVENMEGLVGKRVVVEKNYAIHKLLKRDFPQLRLIEVAFSTDALKLLSTGGADAYISSLMAGQYMSIQLGIPNVDATVQAPFEANNMAIAVRRDWPELASILNKGVDAIRSYEHTAIKKRWTLGIEKTESQKTELLKLTKEEQAWLKAHPSIRLGFNPHMEPLLIKKEDGSLEGIYPEIFAALEKILAIDVTIEVDDWKPIVQRARNRELDGLLACAPVQAEASSLLRTQPIHLSYPVAFTRRDADFTIRHLDDLKGKRVAYQQEVKMLEVVLNEYQNSSEIIPVNSTLEAVGLVLENKADIAFGVSFESYLLAKHSLTGVKLAYFDLKHEASISTGIRDDWPELVSILNKGLAHLGSVRIQKILDQWTNVPAQQQTLDFTPEEEAWLAEHPVITLSATDTNYPIGFRDKKNELKGVNFDYIRILESRLGVSINIEGSPWHIALEKALQHKVDGIIGAAMLEKRKLFLNFTSVYFVYPQALLVNKDDTSIITIEDLTNKKIAIRKGTSRVTLIKEKYPDVQIVEYETLEEAINLLIIEEVDGVFDSLSGLYEFISSKFYINTKFAFTIDVPPVGHARIGLRNTDPIMLSVFNKTIATLTETDHREIDQKWVNLGALPKLTEKKVLILTDEEETWLKEHPEITLGFTTEIEPLLVEDEDGDLSGILIEIYDEFESMTGTKINIELDEWSSTIQKAKDGKIDGLLGSAPSLAEGVGLIHSHLLNSGFPTVFTKTNAPFEINSVKNLEGKKISVLKGIYVVEQALEPYKDTIEIIETESALEMMQMVLAGKVDAAFGLSFHNYLIGKHTLIGIEPVYFSREFKANAVASIKPEWPEYISIMNKILDTIGKDGLNEISKKWTVIEIQKGIQIDLTQEEQAWLDEHPIIRLGSSVNWPPIGFVKDGKYTGVAADYMKRIAELLNVRIEPSKLPSWKETVDAIRAGELDMLDVARDTPQRRDFLSFTRPYLDFPLVIVTGNEISFVSSMTELNGKRVVAQSGSGIQDLLTNKHPLFDLHLVPSLKDGLMAVAQREADAFIGDLAPISYILGKEGLSNIKISGETPYRNTLSIAVRKNKPVLASIMNKALDAIDEEARADIHSRWFSVRYESGYDYTLLWKILAVVAIVLMLFVYWNRRLAMEIGQRIRAEKIAKVARQAAEASQEAAEAANRAKSTFLANMSHELRTPLNAILGFSGMIGRDRDTPTPVQEKVSIINRSGDHLLAMINDILDLSKIEAGRIEQELEVFDLPQMLQDIGRMFEVRAESAQLTFNLELDPELARYIKADIGKLRQILINLLGNAVKFTTEGGFSLRARSQPVTNDLTMIILQLEVKDSGPGIPSEELERIFEPFVQVAQTSTGPKGTGLGLAITQSFVNLLGGKINVESTPGRGSIFYVELPVALAEESEAAGVEVMEPGVIGLEADQSAWRILVVEDSEENRVLLSSLLAQVGFEVREAENGEEGVALFEHWKPHFIWMDMRMPVMDGYEATAKIRELPGGDAVKIVAITASVFGEQHQKILDVGCDEVVHKPFRAQEIFGTMQQHLGVRYIYEEKVDSASSTAEQVIDIAKAKEMAASLPEKLFDELKQAAIALDLEESYEVLDRVAETEPELSNMLRVCVNEMNFSTIQKVLKHE